MGHLQIFTEIIFFRTFVKVQNHFTADVCQTWTGPFHYHFEYSIIYFDHLTILLII